MPRKTTIPAKPVTKDPAAPAPSNGGCCGYKIEKAAKAGMTLAGDECAFTTYALRQGPAIGLSEPTVAFYGPGDKIASKYGAATTTYFFVAGVVFKNCS